MSDDCDMAQIQIENNENRSIAYASIEANKPIQLSDVCLFCGESTVDGRRWCDKFCATEYEKRQALKR